MRFMDRAVDFVGIESLHDAIDDAIDEWHACPHEVPIPLHEYLGMTEEEYWEFVMDPDSLPRLVDDRRLRNARS